MTRLVCLFFSAFLVLSFADPAGDQQQVLAALDAWKQAMLTKDSAALGRLLSDDLTYTHSNSHVESKSDVLAGLAKNPVAAIEFSGTTVRLYGDTAIVKGQGSFHNRVDGKETTTTLSLLQVWVRQSGHWKLVARQATKLGS